MISPRLHAHGKSISWLSKGFYFAQKPTYILHWVTLPAQQWGIICRCKGSAPVRAENAAKTIFLFTLLRWVNRLEAFSGFIEMGICDLQILAIDSKVLQTTVTDLHGLYLLCSVQTSFAIWTIVVISYWSLLWQTSLATLNKTCFELFAYMSYDTSTPIAILESISCHVVCAYRLLREICAANLK